VISVRITNHVNAVTAEHFVLSGELSTGTAKEDIFLMLEKFATGSGLDGFTRVGVTMDGAEARQRVRDVAPNAASFHCFIHREVLAAKVKLNHFMK
jgi:hypothetical protein